jgi:phosphate uptake regulator
MRRKVVQHGPSTLTISLPANWVRNFNIKKGDEISIEQTKDGLLLSAGNERHLGQKYINVKGMKDVIGRAVSALYKAGYDEIVIEYGTPEELERIHHTVGTSYVGFEIVDENRDRVTIRKVSEPTNEEFHTLFRRIFHFLASTASEGFEAAQKNDKAVFHRLVLRDKSINKLANFCRRVVNKRGQNEYAQETAVYHIIEQLEKVGDNYKEINEYLLKKGKISKKMLSFYERVNSIMRDYEDLFFSFSLVKMNAFIIKYKTFVADTDEEADDHILAFHFKSIAHKLFEVNGATMILHL